MERQVLTFSQIDRDKTLDELESQVFDVVIIGGGITGAGVARDAASRGMSVALIEKKDFAQGTSSRSSKLIHGGIRYLENLEFGLVFEALSERRLLFEIAPHLVHPLRFVLPLYEGGRVGMFKMGLGMWLYDALSMFEAPELHERLTAEESLEHLPLLKEQGLLGSFVYSDAYMDDDRLVIETLRDAHKLGAKAVNYVSADSAQLVEGKVKSIGCTDQLGNRKLHIRGHHFVSTVGPWTDVVASSLLGSWKKILRPSKGIHLTFDRNRLKLNQAVVMAADKEKRIVFGIPRHEMIIIGTTDTDFSGDPYDVSTTEDDVRYLLRIAGEYFPGAHLTAEDVIASYSGVRPLVDDGSETESKTSREHVIINDPRNVTFVAGGKYTTYRRMAQHTVESILPFYSLEDRMRFNRGNTKRALNPLATPEKMEESRLLTEEWSQAFSVPLNQVAWLADRHGTEAQSILEQESKLRGTFSHTVEDSIWIAEALHSVRETMCITLIDFYTRRVPLFLSRADHGLPQVELISQVFAHELNWSEQRRQSEVESLKRYMRNELDWKSKFGSTLSFV